VPLIVCHSLQPRKPLPLLQVPRTTSNCSIRQLRCFQRGSTHRVMEINYPPVVLAGTPLHTFAGNFPIDGEVVNLFRACWQLVVVIEFGKRHDTTDTTGICPRPLVTDFPRGNCCSGLWPLSSNSITSICRGFVLEPEGWKT